MRYNSGFGVSVLAVTDILNILWDIQYELAGEHPPVFMLRFSKPAP